MFDDDLPTNEVPFSAQSDNKSTIVNYGVLGAVGDENNVFLPRRTINYPLTIGSPPPTASAYQFRTAIIDEVRRAGNTVVSPQASSQVLSGTGGVGKTQIAASLFASSQADLKVWITADSRESVISGYANSAVRLDLGDANVNLETLAGWFLGHLRDTEKSWLVVLDNVEAGPDMSGLWPPAGGQVIMTTRHRGAAFSGSGRKLINVGVFTQQEACNYLQDRIESISNSLPQNALDSCDSLANALGRLPLALAQAVAVIIDQGISCAQYQEWFDDHARSLEELFPDGADADGYSRTVATTWNLAVLAANKIFPVGLAHPMAVLIALLDSTGIPEAVLVSDPACRFLSSSVGTEISPSMARAAIRALNRLSLIDHETNPEVPRAVRMHNLTARAIRQTLTVKELTMCCDILADALLQVWPIIENDAQLAEALRACTATVASYDPKCLWNQDKSCGHPVLFRSGRSISEAGLSSLAIEYYQSLLIQAEQYLGSDAPDTLSCRNNLGNAWRSAGKLDEAITVLEANLNDRTRILGGDHPDTLSSVNNLGNALESAGKTGSAIYLLKQNLIDRKRVLGPEHPDTLAARNNLANAYQSAGRLDKAIVLLEENLKASTELLGEYHPDTLASVNTLANAFQADNRISEAISLLEQNLENRSRILGKEHPDTLASCNNLGNAYRSNGNFSQAILTLQQNLEVRERVLGRQHRSTLGSVNNLANAYRSDRQFDKAIPLLVSNLNEREKILGIDHPETLASRNNLGNAYRSIGRLDIAIPLLEQNLEARYRLLGRLHHKTISSMNNLANAYRAAGRQDLADRLTKDWR